MVVDTTVGVSQSIVESNYNRLITFRESSILLYGYETGMGSGSYKNMIPSTRYADNYSMIVANGANHDDLLVRYRNYQRIFYAAGNVASNGFYYYRISLFLYEGSSASNIGTTNTPSGTQLWAYNSITVSPNTPEVHNVTLRYFPKYGGVDFVWPHSGSITEQCTICCEIQINNPFNESKTATPKYSIDGGTTWTSLGYTILSGYGTKVIKLPNREVLFGTQKYSWHFSF